MRLTARMQFAQQSPLNQQSAQHQSKPEEMQQKTGTERLSKPLEPGLSWFFP